MGRVIDRSFVNWIKIQLEVLVCLLAVILWVAKEAPAFQVPVPRVVCDGSLNLVVIFTRWLARPLLYVLRIWPFRSMAVRDRFYMSDVAHRV
jgi:hypothetical protein